MQWNEVSGLVLEDFGSLSFGRSFHGVFYDQNWLLCENPPFWLIHRLKFYPFVFFLVYELYCMNLNGICSNLEQIIMLSNLFNIYCLDYWFTVKGRKGGEVYQWSFYRCIVFWEAISFFNANQMVPKLSDNGCFFMRNGTINFFFSWDANFVWIWKDRVKVGCRCILFSLYPAWSSKSA